MRIPPQCDGMMTAGGKLPLNKVKIITRVKREVTGAGTVAF